MGGQWLLIQDLLYTYNTFLINNLSAVDKCLIIFFSVILDFHLIQVVGEWLATLSTAQSRHYKLESKGANELNTMTLDTWGHTRRLDACCGLGNSCL